MRQLLDMPMKGLLGGLIALRHEVIWAAINAYVLAIVNRNELINGSLWLWRQSSDLKPRIRRNFLHPKIAQLVKRNAEFPMALVGRVANYDFVRTHDA